MNWHDWLVGLGELGLVVLIYKGIVAVRNWIVNRLDREEE